MDLRENFLPGMCLCTGKNLELIKFWESSLRPDPDHILLGGRMRGLSLLL